MKFCHSTEIPDAGTVGPSSETQMVYQMVSAQKIKATSLCGRGKVRRTCVRGGEMAEPLDSSSAVLLHLTHTHSNYF